MNHKMRVKDERISTDGKPFGNQHSPEKLKMLPQFLGLVFRVEDGQLGEHAHVRPLQTERGLQQGHQLLEESEILLK